jgi:hypothetical protein
MPEAAPLTLPDELLEWAKARASLRGITVGEYVTELVQLDRVRVERELVDTKLRESLDSGPAAEMTAEDWQEIRDEGARRAAGRRKTG